MEINEIKIKNRVLIKEINIPLPASGIVVVRGENGTGKTLLLRKMHEVLSPASVLVDQNNQEIILKLTVLENIKFGNNNCDPCQIVHVLDDLRLGLLYQNRKMKTLSGGEKKTITLLRAIFSNRHFILLDEPTNDLDCVTVDQLIELIRAKHKDKLFVIVSHDDRFDSLPIQTYEIKGDKLIFASGEKPHVSVEDFHIRNTTEQGKISGQIYSENNLLQKIFKRNNLYTCMNMVLLIILGCNIMLSTYVIDKNVLPVMPKNYFGMFSPMSVIGSDYMANGALPVQLLSLELHAYGDYQYARDIIDASTKNVITYSLDWRLFKDDKVYPIELYNPVERQTLFLLDNKNEAGDQATPSLTISSESNEENVLAHFYQYNDQEYKQVYLSFQNMKREDFILKIAQTDLINGNYYYISRESVALFSSIKTIHKWIENSKIFFLLNLIILIFSICYSLILAHSLIKTFRILTNYGIDSEQIYVVIKQKFSVRYLSVTIIICAILLLLSYKSNDQTLIKDFYAFAFFIYFLQYYFIQKSKLILVRRGLNLARSWRHR